MGLWKVRPLDQGSEQVGSTSGSATWLLCDPRHAAWPVSFGFCETGATLTFGRKGGCERDQGYEVADAQTQGLCSQGILVSVSSSSLPSLRFVVVVSWFVLLCKTGLLSRSPASHCAL